MLVKRIIDFIFGFRYLEGFGGLLPRLGTFFLAVLLVKQPLTIAYMLPLVIVFLAVNLTLQYLWFGEIKLARCAVVPPSADDDMMTLVDEEMDDDDENVELDRVSTPQERIENSLAEHRAAEPKGSFLGPSFGSQNEFHSEYASPNSLGLNNHMRSENEF